MVGEKVRSVYKKKRKGKGFSGRRRQEGKSEEPASVVDERDEIACSTPSTSRDENQLSDSGSNETVGSTRKKMKHANEKLLLDSSDEEITLHNEESEGYRLINMKNLSTAVSNAHVCEEGETFFESIVVLSIHLTYFPYHINP